MSDEQKAAVTTSEEGSTQLEGSQPSTDKQNASPEEKQSFALNKRFSELTGKIKDSNAETAREREARQVAEQKAKDLEDKLAEVTAPQMPPEDLQFENPEEYNRQVQAFDDHRLGKVRNDAVEQAKAELKQEREDERKLEAQKKQRQEFLDQSKEFVTKGEGVGLTEKDLLVSADLLQNAGVSNDIQSFLFADPQGPQIMDFLANNPQQLEAMLELNPVQQSAFIERNIRAEAITAKPTVSGAPDPIINLHGGGVKEQDDFDKSFPEAKIRRSS